VKQLLGLAALLAAPIALGAGEDPAQLMRDLEARLIGARHVLIESRIEARGAVTGSLTGRVELFDRNRAELLYTGSMSGQPGPIALSADGRLLELQSGQVRQSLRVGRESNRALLVGMMRMGLLHNLARVQALQGPDHAEGGVERWARLDSFRPTTYILGGELEGTMSFGFDFDTGEPVPSRLWLDPASSLPRRREITLRVRDGEVKVVEDYTRIVIE
jgi:hypothetical protein